MPASSYEPRLFLSSCISRACSPKSSFRREFSSLKCFTSPLVASLKTSPFGCDFDIIMDNPLETDEERLQTLELLLKLPRPFMLHTHTLTHFPETRLTKLLLEKGLISEMDIEDKKQNGFERYASSLDLGRDKTNMFWDALYYLASTNYLPAKSILALSRSKFIKRNPKPLILLLRSFSSYARTVRRGSKIDLMRFHFWSFIMNKGKLKKIRKYLKSFLGIAQPQ